MLLGFSEALGEAHTTKDIARILRKLTKGPLDTSFFALILEQDGRFVAVESSVLPEDVPLAYSDLSLGEDHPGVLVTADQQPRFFRDQDEFAAQFPGVAQRSSCLVSAQSYLPIVLRVVGVGWLWLTWEDPRKAVIESRGTKMALARYASQALERAELLRERHEVAQTLQEAPLYHLAAGCGA